MAKYKIVHYINQFFANVGGEDMADYKPELREGAIGPGLKLNELLGEDYEIVGTIICGDNYFGENLDEATGIVLDMVKKCEADAVVAGPAFNAGRYGVACGTACKAIEEELNIPTVTGMYVENPGVDMFRKDLLIVETPNSAAGMRKVLPKIANLVKKLVEGEEVLGPKEEGYIERGIRVNYFAEKRGSDRAIDMLLKKIRGEEYVTEYEMPVFDRVDPAEPLKDIKNATIAIVTSGGVVPTGNPDHIESSNATKYGEYSIAGMETMSKDDFTTIHGGYDRQFVMENPNLVVPLDVLRELEKEGAFGKLYDSFFTTTGTGTATGSAAKFGDDIGKKLIADGVDAVILVST